MHKARVDLVVYVEIWLLCQYSLWMDAAELFIKIPQILLKMPVIKCAGGKGLLFCLWNESEYHAC